MPMIKHKNKDKSSVKAQLNSIVLAQIKSYCQWAGIYDLGYFFEKAANDLFLKDEEWGLYKKQMEREEKIE